MFKWKIAIVGAGYMATEHAKALAALPGVEIVGVCGRTPAKAQALAEAYGVSSYATVDELYRTTQADAVVVTVNELSMREICLQAFQHPWVCLLEKPVGLDLADARTILAAATAADCRAWVALNRRSHGSTIAALEAISRNDAPRLVSVLDQQDMGVARDIGQPEPVVLNWMYANSIHLIDYFSVFCRGSVVAVDVTLPWTPANPGHVCATLRYSSGDAGVYQAVWDGPGPWAVTVTNADVRVEMRPLESLTIQRRGERRAVPIELDGADVDFKPGLHVQARELIRALEGHSPRLASLEDATESMALVSTVYGLD
ncbi:MAG: Gfo/Idh/MocA family oxidoreductase [Gemmatimonadales bacterium]|nr:Gfo/Idh/MocA family oxidoreductase [Gemmatimonadales bacterium]